MPRSGWAYTDLGYFNELGGMTGSVQFRTDCNSLSGSTNFVFASSSNRVGIREDLTQPGFDIQRGSIELPLYHPNAALEVRGDMNVTGSIYAKNYYIQNVSYMDLTGSTKFGDSVDDTHKFIGKVGIGTSFETGPSSDRRDPQSLLHLEHTDTTTWPSTITASDEEYGDFLLTLRNHTDTQHAFAGMAFDVTSEIDADSLGAAIVAVADNATSTNHDANLAFATNDAGDDGLTERMRVTHDGKVGIGTTSPTDLLTVAANLSSGTDAGIHIAADADDEAYIDFTEQAGSSVASFGAADAYGFRVVYDGASGVEALQFKTGNATTVNTRMSIKRDTGYVLIGGGAATGLLHVNGATGTGVPTLIVDHDDEDQIGATFNIGSTSAVGMDINLSTTTAVGIDIDASNTEANAFDLAANSVTTAKAMNISADGLTTGNALRIGDDSSDTGSRKSVLIVQNDAAATGATALHVQSDGGNVGIELDKNYEYLAGASTVMGLKIDFDKTGASSIGSTMFGIYCDMDNSTATDGGNTMVGLSLTPTLTHAADAGTTTVKGAVVTATGGTNGTSVATGMELTTTGADTNNGLIIDCTDGGTDLKIVSSADDDDYFSIATTTAGATTITTVDDAGAAANLTFTIDGDIIFDARAGDISFKDDASTGLILDLDTTAGACYFQNGAGNTVIAVDDGDQRLYFYDKGGEHIASDGNHLTLTSGGRIDLTAATDVIIQQNIGLHFDGTTGAEKIESDGTNLTITSGNDIICAIGSGKALTPSSHNVSDLGSDSNRWANVYTGDLHLKNDRGDWTIIEEAEYLTITNNANGKRYKIMMEEIED